MPNQCGACTPHATGHLKREQTLFTSTADSTSLAITHPGAGKPRLIKRIKRLLRKPLETYAGHIILGAPGIHALVAAAVARVTEHSGRILERQFDSTINQRNALPTGPNRLQKGPDPASHYAV